MASNRPQVITNMLPRKCWACWKMAKCSLLDAAMSSISWSLRVHWISTQTPIYNCQCSFQQCRVGSRKLHWDHRSTLPVLQVCEKSFCCMFLLWPFKLLSSIISLSACRLYTLSVYWVFLKASPNYGLCKYAQYICMNEIDKMLNLFEQ